MATLNDKPVRLLMHDMIQDMGLMPGQMFRRQDAINWFAKNYPNVKQGTVTAHLIRLSTNTRTRLHYGVRADGTDDKFFKVDGSHFRLYEQGKDPAPISDSNETDVDDSDPIDESSEEFAYERDLRDYLAKNLHLIEPGLTLYNDEGITGVEFPVGGRFIDILAVDSDGGYVVVELKVSKGYDRVVGQLLRYRNWIKKNHAEPDQLVRGVIVANKISDDLVLACSDLDGISLYEYSLSVAINSVTG